MAVELLEGLTAKLLTVSIFDREVHGVEELEEAYQTSQAKLRVPAAYVILLNETALRNEHISVIDQRVTATFGVVLAIENTLNQRVRGGGYKSRLQEVRAALLASLIGWQADPDYDPVEYVKGRMVSVQDGVLWWQDEFYTAYYLRNMT